MSTLDISFDDLVDKKRYYQCKVSDSIIYDFFDAKVNKIVQTKNGFKLSIFLKENDMKYFDYFDKKILEYFQSKNQIWFDNNLTEDDIKEMYNQMYCHQNKTIDIDITEKTVIKKNNECVEIKDVYDQLKEDHVVLDVKIQYIGFNTYNYLIENKWIIKKINISQIDDIVEEDKNSIEKFLQNSVDDCINILDKEIVKIYEKKRDVEETYV